jgi:CRP-like cAMP-binding protein
LVGDRPSPLIVLTISGSAATVLLLLGGLAEQGFDGGDHVCGTVLAGDPTGQLPVLSRSWRSVTATRMASASLSAVSERCVIVAALAPSWCRRRTQKR